MNSTTKAWIAAAIGVVFSLGLIVWQVKARHVAPINLSAEDMSLIASDQAAQSRMRLAANETARKDFAKNVRELLAVAEEARSSTAKVRVQNPDGTWTDKEPIRYRAEIRHQLGMTQTQLAEASGLSQARISQIENGDAVSLESLRAYVSGLGGHLDIVARIGNIQLNVA